MASPPLTVFSFTMYLIPCSGSYITPSKTSSITDRSPLAPISSSRAIRAIVKWASKPMSAFDCEREIEPNTYNPESMRMMIQTPVVLRILTSCFAGLAEIRLSQWAKQPDRTPRNRNPSGWRTEGESPRLAKGMPNVSPTGLKGGPIQQRAELNAENFGLEEEMLQATE